MKAREYFGLGVRLFGLWMICRGATYLASFADIKLYPSSEKAKEGAAALLIYVVIDFGLAAIFLLWTQAVVTLSYGDDLEAPKTEPVKAEDASSSEHR